MRFTGHLDLHHTWERMLRRAGIAVEHTRGYNPRMRISLGLALPLGYTSECELIDVLLEEQFDTDELLKAVQRDAPAGLVIHSAQAIDSQEPTLQKQIHSATYEARIPETEGNSNLGQGITALLNSAELPRERRGKAYDLRPLIETLESSMDDDEGISLVMRLAARPGATGRPDEVLLALGLDPLAARIHRKVMHFESL
jgi:radical SAM-linked protein